MYITHYFCSKCSQGKSVIQVTFGAFDDFAMCQFITKPACLFRQRQKLFSGHVFANGIHAESINAFNNARSQPLERLHISSAIPWIRLARRAADGLVALEESRDEGFFCQRRKHHAAE